MAASRCFRTFASSMSWWSHFLRYWTLLLNWWIFVQCTAVSDIEMETTHCASRCSFFLSLICFIDFVFSCSTQGFWCRSLGNGPTPGRTSASTRWACPRKRQRSGWKRLGKPNASASLDMLLDEILLVWQPFRFQLVKYPSNLFVTSSFCADGAWHHDLLSHGGGGVHCCALNQWGSGVQAVSC